MSDDGGDPGGDGTGGVPPDVRATLDALLSTVEAVDPDADGDPETALSALDTAATVVENKVPDPDECERLAHGCERARTALSAGRLDLAREYARSLRARL